MQHTKQLPEPKMDVLVIVKIISTVDDSNIVFPYYFIGPWGQRNVTFCNCNGVSPFCKSDYDVAIQSHEPFKKKDTTEEKSNQPGDFKILL